MRKELPKVYDPRQVEPRIYQMWMDGGCFKAEPNPDKKPFSIVMPPPNVTGQLHMGHAMDATLQDILIRFKRMQGYEALWLPGTDHAGIATQIKVEENLRQEGLTRYDLGREKFLERVWAWKEKYGNRIVEQQKKMGSSCDWDRSRFTMDEGCSDAVKEVFVRLYDKGLIYRGNRMVNWCPHCNTSISDAEVEYEEKDGSFWHLLYPVKETGEMLELATTRPETMLGDTAVAINGEAPRYAHLHGCHVVLPLLNKEIPIVCDEHADMTKGTGVVKITPAHDPNDFEVGLRHDLPIVRVFTYDGHMTGAADKAAADALFAAGKNTVNEPEVLDCGKYAGMTTEESNPVILADMKEAGSLFASEDIVHSYPHCWRCKHPVLFRATDQWFVSMDKTGLREQAGKEVRENVKWYPAHAANRIGAMVEQRPDWCISRQRNWGVPIPSYTCADCGEKVMNDATLDAVIKLFHEKGSDAWFTDAPESYLGEACVCPKCGGHHLKADKDILDVWWDSGVSWKAVCEYRPELEYPADVYLEGSDQHRGWFQSSLLTSVGANGHAPYKAVVSQGFTLDGQGRKMSKSLGNVIDPNKVCDEMGADIIRLWVASVDTSSDVSIDHEILARTSDAYRRFRNTLRFLLSELEGQFEPETDGVAFADLLPLDKLMVARLTQVQAEVDDAYSCYEFPRAYRALYDFVVTELSNVYLDALKDRLYCEKPGSLERRSAQTVLAELFSMLMRDLQPILSYTVDEAMAYAPAGCVDHQKYAALLDWYKSPITFDEANEFEGVLEASLELRSAVTKALEDARSAGTFTKSQQVRVKAVVPAEMYALLTGDKAVDLAEFYIVSDVELTQGEELSVAIEAAEGECCDRCWNYRTTVGEYNGHAHICKRCAEALN